MKIIQIVGGGISWLYAIKDNKIIGASHKDDKNGMKKLRSL